MTAQVRMISACPPDKKVRVEFLDFRDREQHVVHAIDLGDKEETIVTLYQDRGVRVSEVSLLDGNADQTEIPLHPSYTQAEVAELSDVVTDVTVDEVIVDNPE